MESWNLPNNAHHLQEVQLKFWEMIFWTEFVRLSRRKPKLKKRKGPDLRKKESALITLGIRHKYLKMRDEWFVYLSFFNHKLSYKFDSFLWYSSHSRKIDCIIIICLSTTPPDVIPIIIIIISKFPFDVVPPSLLSGNFVLLYSSFNLSRWSEQGFVHVHFTLSFKLCHVSIFLCLTEFRDVA